MTIKCGEMTDLDRFLFEAPAPMSHALSWLKHVCGDCEDALENALNTVLKVEQETDVESKKKLLLEMAEKIGALRGALEETGYRQSESWAVVEEMQRFAMADNETE